MPDKANSAAGRNQGHRQSGTQWSPVATLQPLLLPDLYALCAGVHACAVLSAAEHIRTQEPALP